LRLHLLNLTAEPSQLCDSLLFLALRGCIPIKTWLAEAICYHAWMWIKCNWCHWLILGYTLINWSGNIHKSSSMIKCKDDAVILHLGYYWGELFICLCFWNQTNLVCGIFLIIQTPDWIVLIGFASPCSCILFCTSEICYS
jgi:hypothetical protein